MIRIPEVLIERIAVVRGCETGLADAAIAAARLLPAADYGAVIAATFSNHERFPSLAVRVSSALGLPVATPAFDLQMACSAYPYAVYLAGRLACDTGKAVLVLDGDAQTRLVDAADPATGKIFSNAMTATVVSAGHTRAESAFAFLSRADEALLCSETGPIRMDGFKVFSFVATEVSAFLRAFGTEIDQFAPHQANPYMVRQLAKTLGLGDQLLTIDAVDLNPGSCSIPMALASGARPGRVLLAGFGAGYSAAAGIVRIADDFKSYLPRQEISAHGGML